MSMCDNESESSVVISKSLILIAFVCDIQCKGQSNKNVSGDCIINKVLALRVLRDLRNTYRAPPPIQLLILRQGS